MHWLIAIGGLLLLGQLVPADSAIGQTLSDALSVLTGGAGGSASTAKPGFTRTPPTTVGPRGVLTLQSPLTVARAQAAAPTTIVAPRAAAPVIVGVSAPAPYAPYVPAAAPVASYEPVAGGTQPFAPQPFYGAPDTSAGPAPAPAPPPAAPEPSDTRYV